MFSPKYGTRHFVQLKKKRRKTQISFRICCLFSLERSLMNILFSILVIYNFELIFFCFSFHFRRIQHLIKKKTHKFSNSQVHSRYFCRRNFLILFYLRQSFTYVFHIRYLISYFVVRILMHSPFSISIILLFLYIHPHIHSCNITKIQFSIESFHIS